ncbi:unnamed protein product [Triticum turgidum subsp. durum]|uniref:Uncharacterized protein n=1 Tax=Triticum turgidum subsp. durum TaxID=4567 RepID=A0A9R1RX64_TRITD|nr:unnamed protein product [Triticum turgidum subsp. durum]
MVMLKKNTSTLRCFVAALMVVMAATLLSSCDARKQMDEPHSFPLPASCYSKHFPNCTDERCKKSCSGDDMPPVPGAFCNDDNNCCCPI